MAADDARAADAASNSDPPLCEKCGERHYGRTHPFRALKHKSDAAYGCECGPDEYCAADDCHGATAKGLNPEPKRGVSEDSDNLTQGEPLGKDRRNIPTVGMDSVSDRDAQHPAAATSSHALARGILRAAWGGPRAQELWDAWSPAERDEAARLSEAFRPTLEAAAASLVRWKENVDAAAE